MRTKPRLKITLLAILIPVFIVVMLIGMIESGGVTYAETTQRQQQQTTPNVQFTAFSYTVDENDSDGLVTINVQISAVPTTTANTVTVTYATADGTATSGVDYVSTSGSLTFAPGDSAIKSFEVTIINDTTPESNEVVNLILQDPQNAVLGTRSIAELIIQSEDASPTPTGAAPTPIFADRYEANNTLSTAYTLQINDTTFCSDNDATMWPAGDIDYYRFWGRAGGAYVMKTDNLDVGLDTNIRLLGPEGQLLAQNDNIISGNQRSELTYSVGVDGYYYIEVTNRDGSDPADKTYCVQVTEIAGTATPTPLPTSTRVAGADICEPNFDRDNACLIAPNEVVAGLNFVPTDGDGPDNDFFKMWIREGWYYECETQNLSGFNDTNMILYDQNGNGIAGNNDRSFNDLGSLVPFQANYTGWLYVLVGPVVPVDYRFSNLYTYDLTCVSTANTPTPTPRPTHPPSSGSSGGGTGGGVTMPRPTRTPTVDPNATPTPDLVATIQALETRQSEEPMATDVPRIDIAPLPTDVPPQPSVFNASFTVVVFYDKNGNNLPEIDEGIQETAVLVNDGATGDLLSLGYTNEAGLLRFSVTASSDLLKVSIPYLGLTQTFGSDVSEILIRVAPSTLPNELP